MFIVLSVLRKHEEMDHCYLNEYKGMRTTVGSTAMMRKGTVDLRYEASQSSPSLGL